MQPQTVCSEALHNKITPVTTHPSSTAVSSSIASSELSLLTESSQALI